MSVKYLAAYALVQLGGKKPTKDDVKAVLKAAGIAVDEKNVDSLFTSFEGKDFNATVAEGMKKIGSAAPAAGGAAAGAAAKKDDKKADDKKPEPKKAEEKKPAPKPADDDDDLFGGGLF
jgi:ribosomal protein L12E/L44/L45/RPP1/RPP2